MRKQEATMDRTTRLYFAYGSNMNAGILAQRLGKDNPSDFRRRSGILLDHSIAFSKVSSSDSQIGYANIEPCKGSRVEGVINELTDGELDMLDSIELVPVHYNRMQFGILDVKRETRVQAFAYVANPAMVLAGLKPLSTYVDTLLDASDMLSDVYVQFLSSLSRA